MAASKKLAGGPPTAPKGPGKAKPKPVPEAPKTFCDLLREKRKSVFPTEAPVVPKAK